MSHVDDRHDADQFSHQSAQIGSVLFVVPLHLQPDVLLLVHDHEYLGQVSLLLNEHLVVEAVAEHVE